MAQPTRRLRTRTLLLFGALVAACLAAARRGGVSPVRVEGSSMEPALPEGALVAVSPRRGTPSYGAVVVVRRDDATEHIKRVVAVPGDRARLASGGTFTLGPGEFAVEGDNREASTDSRHYGPVELERIVAVARFCYWPPRAWGLLSTP